jgi:hypothetical protein
MKKLLLGLTTVFALSAMTPAYAADADKADAPAKSAKKGKKPAPPKEEKPKAEEKAPAK